MQRASVPVGCVRGPLRGERHGSRCHGVYQKGPGMTREEQHLTQAEHHIADGEQRITRQAQIVEELAQAGQDTTAARELLETLKQSRALMERHH